MRIHFGETLPIDVGVVSRAWEGFIAGENVAQNAVRRLIKESWTRSLAQGVDPARHGAPLAVSGDRFHVLKRQHQELIEAAHPSLEQARDFLIESGTVMVLTDPNGVILWIEGDEVAKEYGKEIGLAPGSLWGESATGTNAIGTALAAGHPTQICSAEHFRQEIKRWTCSASVIRDPLDGTILGSLDISGLSGSHNTHCMALAVSGAGRIENRLASMEMEKRSQLLDYSISNASRWASEGVVIFDRRGRLIRANDNANRFFDRQTSEGRGACESLNLSAAPETDGTNMPDWVRKDWLQPVVQNNERLGTLLIIPTASAQMNALSTPPRKQDNLSAKEGPIAEIMGNSPTMTTVKDKANQLAKLSVPVLLLGPTGAGKEVFAQALHYAGSNPTGPFIAFNCGGITRDLLASELFGYVEGAFTGARRGGQIGKFEAANGGTLFLDEIGEMPMELQSHLLRVLEDGVVYRLGENKPRKVSIRLIAATNRDLKAAIAKDQFRMDLYYRLAVTVLKLPSLVEHCEDIPLLSRHFIEKTSLRYGVAAKRILPDVMEILMNYSWPGNVRELRNVVESMVLLSQGETITVQDLPSDLLDVAPVRVLETPPSHVSADPMVGKLDDIERDAIASAIRAEWRNMTLVAKRLGIAKSTLYSKMKRHGLNRQFGLKDEPF